MKWPWRRTGAEKAAAEQPPTTVPAEETGDLSGQEAREQAQGHLAETQSRWPEVHRVSSSLRDLRERNHFADQIQHIFEGGPRT